MTGPGQLTGPVLTAGDLALTLTAGGDVRSLRTPALLVNQYLPGEHDTAPGGLLLRRHSPVGTALAPLTGSADGLAPAVGEDRASWSGTSLGLHHRVDLTLDGEEGLLVWRIDLTTAEGAVADDGVTYDVVIAQDLGLAPPAAALSSEAYVCQYLLHRAVAHERFGTALISRQSMSALPRLPLHVLLLVEGAQAHLTDGLQVHTAAARRDGLAHGLLGPLTPGVLQYEYAMATLVSHPLDLTSGAARLHAVQVVREDAPGPLAEHEASLATWAARAVAVADAGRGTPAPAATDRPAPSALRRSLLLPGDDLGEDALLAALGLTPADVLLPERSEHGALLSFFTPTGSHVVAGAKDTITERSHGHVLKAGDAVAPTDDVLSATAFAPGVFASHVVLGNTSANRLVTVHRHHLNLLRSSGLRILLDDGAGPRLLGLPTAVTFDVGGIHWLYASPLGRIDVRTVACARTNRIDVTLTSERELDLTATIELDDEAGGWDLLRHDARTLVVAPTAGGDVAAPYPALRYAVASAADLQVTADGRLETSARGRALAVTFTGALTGAPDALALLGAGTEAAPDVEASLTGHRATVRALVGNLRLLDHPGVPARELDLLLGWYAHNALIHFLVPHGLEQYSGAAWGTRDVSQGPFELMLTGGRPDVARDILVRVLAHQLTDGDFPQWFMFDAYAERYQDSSHGDVVVWPLFALAQYLRDTGDIGLLDERVPFWDGASRAPVTDGPDADASVREHAARILDHVEQHRLPGTALPAYGEGDWDDTLQPADEVLRTHLASTWTSALLVQASELLADHLPDGGADGDLAARLRTLAREVAADLRARGLVDGVMAGYVRHSPDGVDDLVIHPRDTTSGMTYRLIPMTRSILAGIFTPQEARDHEAIVAEHLQHPDGVRLMDRPADFDEGIPQTFLRAEQAANVGREIGLMYTHAHIRWVEALTELGRARALEELLRVSPLDLAGRVPNAAPRQRNAYFSSSDADLPDRASFAAEFERVRSGEVAVRGGWRVYSSGPGIFLRQLVQRVLGIAQRGDHVVLDPVLAAEADGLTVSLDLAGRRRTITYRVLPSDGEPLVLGGSDPGQLTPLATRPREGRYRRTGLALTHEALGAHSHLELHVPAGT